ncbi:elongation of very long chain fatty acids protein-like isoform X2 [Leptotrombidium deliense]|uniref:Elongation of very long chain fatty acids protein n=1 Tax=Leptotrombidium deliense TaxID=299467 RepID=A0A443SFP0_9ACAR|nr:elongation of very long chain fatty acids protein-like isoform X2 [Leptotrombidium deliense]
MNGTQSLMEKTAYFLHDFWEDIGDPRSSQLPLIYGGPWKIMGICFLYWYFVRVIGPSFMKGRQPFDLRAIMLLHNSFLIGVNGCGFLIALWLTDCMQRCWDCGRVDPNTEDFKDKLSIYLGYVYLLTKFFDFGDTIFFVLRKKYNQASFLHVFHHGVMPIAAYVGLKTHPGGYSGFLPVINIFVHAVMYTYYALACAGPEMKKYLWWKKYITQMQMIQFVLVFIHSMNAAFNPNCHWPTVLTILEALHATMFFFMFYSFYRRSYSKSLEANNNLLADKSTPNGIKKDN